MSSALVRISLDDLIRIYNEHGHGLGVCACDVCEEVTIVSACEQCETLAAETKRELKHNWSD